MSSAIIIRIVYYVPLYCILGTFTCSVGTANASCCMLATPLCSVGTVGASFCMLGTPSNLYCMLGTANASYCMLGTVTHALYAAPTCLVLVQPFYIVYCTLMFVYCILELVPMSTATILLCCVCAVYFLLLHAVF